MTWAKLDDQFPDHPKVAGLSDPAFRLHVTALCTSARFLSDGLVLAGQVGRLYAGDTKPLTTELVRAGLWQEVSGGWVIHDWLTYNPSRAQVFAERAKRKAAAETGGHARQAQADRLNGRGPGGRFAPVPPVATLAPDEPSQPIEPEPSVHELPEPQDFTSDDASVSSSVTASGRPATAPASPLGSPVEPWVVQRRRHVTSVAPPPGPVPGPGSAPGGSAKAAQPQSQPSRARANGAPPGPGAAVLRDGDQVLPPGVRPDRATREETAAATRRRLGVGDAEDIPLRALR